MDRFRNNPAFLHLDTSFIRDLEAHSQQESACFLSQPCLTPSSCTGPSELHPLLRPVPEDMMSPLLDSFIPDLEKCTYICLKEPSRFHLVSPPVSFKESLVDVRTASPIFESLSRFQNVFVNPALIYKEPLDRESPSISTTAFNPPPLTTPHLPVTTRGGTTSHCHTLSKEKRLQMIEVYIENKTPRTPVLKELAGRVGISLKQCQYWFQNRRASERRKVKMAAEMEAEGN
ncbi:hypothetical protein HDU98_006096 [Podochytrium sp. JEL0797]|nr:hypothetical protein HDU98_006096 [Podochytrium sp. JEL0797]